jgi:GT2 family glycosyltransferase
MSNLSVVVPNWNGADHLKECLDSLLAQSVRAQVIVVDNGSTDESLQILDSYEQNEVIRNSHNKGFAGGVNDGFRRAIELGHDFVAAFNNDAVADIDWLKHLVAELEANPKVGAATCKFLSRDGKHLDSTGDYYTVWGLPYPRGRGETDLNAYDQQTEIFGASGGASLYRVKMLKEIGLFDEDFFAYYEDVDLSFRAQLAGWKIRYVPAAVAYHHIGATSSKIKGFATYQTLKNIPLMLWKDMPRRYFWRTWPRMVTVFWLFSLRALLRGQVGAVAKGIVMGPALWPKILIKRYGIQKSRKATDEYIWQMLIHDLPPNARTLRRLRSWWWRLRRKS